MKDSGRQIGEKLFVLLSPSQKKELTQFVRDYEAGNIPADAPYTTFFRGQYFISSQANQPLTEIREGDLYFCLEQRLVTVRNQIILLTVKEFEIFALLIQNPKRVFTYEMLMELVWHTLFIASYDVPVFDNLTALIALVVLSALLIFTLIYLLYAFITSQAMRKEIIPLTLEK